MLIVKKLVKQDDGSWEANWSLEEEQMSFLLTYAINNLVNLGLLETTDTPQEDNEQGELFNIDTDGMSKQ